MYAAFYIFQVLPVQKYHLILNFCISIKIFENSIYLQQYGEYGHKLIKAFIKQFIHFFGKSVQSFNLHALLHVYEDCRKHGPLSSYSAFNFETFNMKFYRYIKARKKPIT